MFDEAVVAAVGGGGFGFVERRAGVEGGAPGGFCADGAAAGGAGAPPSDHPRSHSASQSNSRRVQSITARALSEARKASKGKVDGGNTTIAVHLRPVLGGDPLVALKADAPVVPASNLKVLTVATALELLGCTVAGPRTPVGLAMPSPVTRNDVRRRRAARRVLQQLAEGAPTAPTVHPSGVLYGAPPALRPLVPGHPAPSPDGPPDRSTTFTQALTKQWQPASGAPEVQQLLSAALASTEFHCDAVEGEFSHIGTTRLFRQVMTEETDLSHLYALSLIHISEPTRPY